MPETVQSSTNATSPDERAKLNPALYSPSPEEVAFLKDETGIQDDEELKQHVLAVQRKAWDLAHYRCILTFEFTKLKISRLPLYDDLLTLAKKRPDALFLDFACCFGNDARKAISDGYPLRNVITSDLVKDFWDLGHTLFKSTPESFPVAFIPGDIFDPLHVAPAQPHYSPPATSRPANLSELTSLTPLQGHISAIHASAFFHLLDEAEQLAAARALASLLSTSPGSMIFGTHSSSHISGLRTAPNQLGKQIYCYNPEDWRAMWDGVVFENGAVEVKVTLVDSDPWRGQGPEIIADELGRRSMVWCAKRL
ncbi:hypothetical protein DFH11DRAFT_1577984 [Phellopilus nigrolimitatus]|nr:hypothetical protein DFH11DRAFT_1577984 [Phellopilus nigrolimitatus]